MIGGVYVHKLFGPIFWDERFESLEWNKGKSWWIIRDYGKAFGHPSKIHSPLILPKVFL